MVSKSKEDNASQNTAYDLIALDVLNLLFSFHKENLYKGRGFRSHIRERLTMISGRESQAYDPYTKGGA